MAQCATLIAPHDPGSSCGALACSVRFGAESPQRPFRSCRVRSRVARRHHLHKISRNIVNRFGRIAVEDLNIKGLARGMLAKHVADASWAQLAAMLDYKAASAGVKFVRVDPRGTSQQCPRCGQVAAKALDERRHRCDCGADIDRDVAAAMVVHFRAFGFWPGTGLESLSERVAA